MRNKFLSSRVATALLFVLAAALIGYGGINAAAAAPRVVSEWYGAEVVLTNIHTAIVENDVVVKGDRTLLGESFAKANPGLEWEKDEKGNYSISGFAVGVKYREELCTENVKYDEGTIPQYVRVTVYKYWTKAGTEEKLPNLDPSFIQLHFVTGGDWTIDPAASTAERTVLYYSGIVEPKGRTPIFMDSIYVSPEVATLRDKDGKLLYEGAECHIKATVDAVQTHNSQEAMTGAWGRTN